MERMYDDQIVPILNSVSLSQFNLRKLGLIALDNLIALDTLHTAQNRFCKTLQNLGSKQ